MASRKLSTYRAKRDFRRTADPATGRWPGPRTCNILLAAADAVRMRDRKTRRGRPDPYSV